MFNWPDVASFLINCGISFLAFAGAFHLTYGNHMSDFATMGESFMTLYRFSMGDWDVALLQSYQVGCAYLLQNLHVHTHMHKLSALR